MDIFCKIINGELPSNVCYENDDLICIMDINPFSPGHTLIIPKKHYTTILDMDADIINKIHEVAKKLIIKMENNFPDITGVKVVVNYGSPQVVKHYHMHLLPMYNENKKPKLTQEEFCELLKK